MKKMLMTICLAVGIILCQGCRNYMAVSIGSGGPTDSTSYACEVGTVSQDSIYTIGFLAILNGGDASYDESTEGEYSDLFEWEQSIGTVHSTGTYRDWPEMGLFCRYGRKVKPNLFISILGGITYVDEVEVYESDIRVYPYSYGKPAGEEIEPLFGGGVIYSIDNTNISVSVDYDNRRGIVGGLGFRF